jgi:hypothetical protein
MNSFSNPFWYLFLLDLIHQNEIHYAYILFNYIYLKQHFEKHDSTFRANCVKILKRHRENVDPDISKYWASLYKMLNRGACIHIITPSTAHWTTPTRDISVPSIAWWSCPYELDGPPSKWHHEAWFCYATAKLPRRHAPLLKLRALTMVSL